MSNVPVVTMQSVMNLSYKNQSCAKHPKPRNFEEMKERYSLSKELYHRKKDLQQSIQELLVPAKDHIEKQKSCECGPEKQSKKMQRKQRSHTEWTKRADLEALSKDKKIQLLEFYNNQLRKVKFTRNSVVVIKSNSSRQKQLNVPILAREKKEHTKLMEQQARHELNQTVPQLKRSDSTYLKKKFKQISQKGLDKVRREDIHGSLREIESETLNILKQKKKRFNAPLERRNEFYVGNFLSNMMANEEADTQEKAAIESAQKIFERGKGKGYVPNLKKQRLFILRQNDIKQRGKFKMQNQSSQADSEMKSVGETFIPFVQERDAIGRMFSQTLLNNRMKSTVAMRQMANQRNDSRLDILGHQSDISARTLPKKSGASTSQISTKRDNYDHLAKNQNRTFYKVEKMHTTNSITKKGDPIIPLIKNDAMAKGSLNSYRNLQSDENYITAQEISELNLIQKQLTLNLKESMKHATFYGFSDLQKLEDELKETQSKQMTSYRNSHIPSPEKITLDHDSQLMSNKQDYEKPLTQGSADEVTNTRADSSNNTESGPFKFESNARLQSRLMSEDIDATVLSSVVQPSSSKPPHQQSTNTQHMMSQLQIVQPPTASQDFKIGQGHGPGTAMSYNASNYETKRTSIGGQLSRESRPNSQQQLNMIREYATSSNATSANPTSRPRFKRSSQQSRGLSQAMSNDYAMSLSQDTRLNQSATEAQSRQSALNDPPIVFKKKDWAIVDTSAIDQFAVKLQEQGGFNMRSWNKVMGDKQLMPNIGVQREAFRMYQNL